MALGISVYVTVIGLLIWSIAIIAWVVWTNRKENPEQREGMGFFERKV